MIKILADTRRAVEFMMNEDDDEKGDGSGEEPDADDAATVE